MGTMCCMWPGGRGVLRFASSTVFIITLYIIESVVHSSAGVEAAAGTSPLQDAAAKGRRRTKIRWQSAASSSQPTRNLQDFASFTDINNAGDDSLCLKMFLDSLTQPADKGSSSMLRSTWTLTALETPCSTPDVSPLLGISCNNSQVSAIKLPFADLSGSLSPSISACSALKTLDLSSNNLVGYIPSSLGSLSSLVTLSLFNNQLSGPIPVELATCSSLNSIDLHQNQLSGSIPGQLGLLPLQYFDVSHNKLSGLIPFTLSNTSSGAPRFNASSFADNKDLYGYPLPPFDSTAEPLHRHITSLEITIFTVAACILSVFTVAVALAICMWRFMLSEARKKILVERRWKDQNAAMAETEQNSAENSSDEVYVDGWKEVLRSL